MVAALGCGSSAKATAADVSTALRAALETKAPTFTVAEDDEREHHHYNVYLHATPAPALFNRVERDFSHGCVRLDRPADLAKYLLRDQPEWSDAKIAEAMHSGTEQSVPIKQPLPIYLVHFTTWEENGVLQRAPDVYGLDRRQHAATTNSQ
jgi:murein L,D-transpeptidase YcbB/YkuD